MIRSSLKVFERIQPYRTAGACSSRASGPLNSRCLSDSLDVYRWQTGPRRIGRDARQAAVNHCCDAFYGDRALGYVGRQDDLLLAGRLDSAILLVRRQIAVERYDQKVVGSRKALAFTH